MVQFNLGDIRLKDSKILKFGDSDEFTFFCNNENQLTLKSTTDLGKLAFTAGTGGIVIDSSAGSGTSGTVNGPISLISKADSNWQVTSANLNLETAGSGNVLITAAESMNLTGSANSTYQVNSANLNLKTDTTGNVAITAADALTLSSSNGAINLNATGAANVVANENDLSLSTVTSGNVIITSAGSISETAGTSHTMDAATIVSIGTTAATDVFIGRDGQNTTINGNLIVSGTTTTVSGNSTIFTDNLIVLNSGPSGEPLGATYDGGLLVDRSAADVTSDVPSHATGTSTGSTTTTVKLEDSTDYTNHYIKLTDGLMNGQFKLITSMTGDEATVSEWQSTPLTGSNFTVGSSGTTLVGIETQFETELRVGATISINDQNYVVLSIADDVNATLDGVNSTDGNAPSSAMLSPGNVTYSIYKRSLVGMFYQEATDKFVFASTLSDPGQATVTIGDFLDVKMNAITTTETANAAWSGSSFTSGAMLMDGGLGTTKNIMIQGDGSSVGDSLMTIAQTNANGAQPTLYMSQADNTQGIISIKSASADGGKIQSLVKSTVSAEADLSGFVKVYIDDTNSTNGITSGYYFIPIYALA